MTRFKWKHAWLFLLYPFIWLSTRLETRRHRSGPGHAAGEEDLFRWMARPAMLGSEQLLLTARKASLGPRRHERAGGHDHLHRLLGRHLEVGDLFLRNDEQEARRRVDGARDEEAAEPLARLLARFSRRPST